MKIATVITLFVAVAVAAPAPAPATLEQLQARAKQACGTGKRDAGVITRVLHSALDNLKDKREITEVDVDEISNALYGGWCTP
ncbi:hypothetical protein B0T22DRAFT_162122 [Podospora appendiculata]|uniref:Uncharacterized protein n=1 Tax=Podospora appendiculata TaxID=314037 RepID=A0AAE0X9X4_9PEZI|nr:hypothetical protein B0T22DRAFT_162122 [Podospora appendiculata]